MYCGSSKYKTKKNEGTDFLVTLVGLFMTFRRRINTDIINP